MDKAKTRLISYPIGKQDTKYCIPDGVTVIDDYAFEMCTALEKIILPESVTEIGEWAFADCNGLTGEFVIPESVTTIGDKAFRTCHNLTKIIISDSVTSIADETFRYCEEDITICCSVGSYAENYAKKHNIKYQTA